MFHGKFVTIIEVQPVVETQTIIAIVKVVDVSVTTRSNVIEEQVFKDKKLRKTKSVVDWEKEEQLKKSMVEIIQQIQKTQT
jgi:phosphopantothenate synthetase